MDNNSEQTIKEKVTIYTNEGNPLGLKLLLLAKFAKKDTNLQKININNTTIKGAIQLPILELKSGVQLFSTDSVAKYFFPDEGRKRDEWLEWASVLLAPAVSERMGVTPRFEFDPASSLNALTKKLNDHLQKSQFIVGDKLTAADISIWCLLASDGFVQNAKNIDNILSWYQKILEMPEVKEALLEQPLKEIKFVSLQHSNRFGGLHKTVSMSNEQFEKRMPESHGFNPENIFSDELEIAKSAFIHNPAPEQEEPRIVLPKPGERNVLITSALPYVNNVPHLGNIIGSVLSADIFARYSRMTGNNTLYVSGTDEYGTATENKAISENLTPKQICDKYFEVHNSIYRWFGIGFDYFGRTTIAEQTEVVQQAFNDIHAAGYIFKDSVEQLLCQKCDRFLADRFVEGTCPHPGCGYEDARGDQCDKCGKLINAIELQRPRCKECNNAPVVRSSSHLFIDLPKIEPQLKEWIDKSDHGWTNNARVITRSWLKEGLKPRCITRDLKWGIPVPLKDFENKVFYVWFDAPFGYISITKRYTKDYEKWWKPSSDINVELFQFMAKDNVPFHSVMFPSSLLSIKKGYTLVSHIISTEYLNYEDGKFSKSRGIGVFGNDAQNSGISADVWRFYLASARPESQDSNFIWSDFAARNNFELLNNFGNFVNRALVFCEKNFNGSIPIMKLTDDELYVIALINREIKNYIASMEKAKLRDGIRHIMSISRHGNCFLQSQQPWVLLKGTDDQKSHAGTIIGVCCNIACLLANLVFPFMPTTARTLLKQLNTKQTLINTKSPFISILLPPGHRIGKPAPLFTKIEQSTIDELKQKYGGKQQVLSSNTNSQTQATLSISSIEATVQKQADKVRTLKESKADKSIWQPEVNILLDLKKQLAAAQQQVSSSNTNSQTQATLSIPSIEATVQKQADKVRTLKESKADKSIWQPEVNILLDLKKQLAAAQQQVSSSNTNSQTKTTLPIPYIEAAVQKQADKVRALKGSKADKSIWQPEVNILLDLKKQLAAAQANTTVKK